MYRNNSNFFRLISIHAPRTGSDVQRFRQLRALLPISIHAPRTGSDHPCASAAAALPHFNPRSPHGERRRPPAAANLSGYFNPRSPHGERPYDLSYYVLHQEISIHAPRTGSTSAMGKCCRRSSYFNPRSPHGERHTADKDYLPAEYRISIHAPRTGSDAHTRFPVVRPTHFNPRSPHGGATAICWTSLWGWIFQSTLPARGATILRLRQHLRHRISIHAPRTGSDVFVLSQLRRLRIFQSTLPARGATFSFRRVAQLDLDFNPRSPRRGATATDLRTKFVAQFQSTLPARGATRPRVPESPHRNFNPRSPHGERRRQRPKKKIKKSYFNPRSPHGERRGILSSPTDERRISIHAPRTGSDFRRSVKGFPPKYFNPRSPHGERRRQEPLGTVCPEISIHAPSTGSDRWDRPKTSGKGISIHAPRTGSDKRRPVARRKPQTFQSTLPARGATLQRDYHGALDVVFQSTLPATGSDLRRL